MALQTQLQYTETNLVGYLNESVDTSDTTIYVRFYDRVTGDARTPLATTLMFVIDKGSSAQPSSAYEIILATSHSTTNGVTTLTGCVRGLAFSGTALTVNTSLRKNHVARAEVGTVDLHYYTAVINATLKGVGDQPIFKIYASAATRDADVPTPSEGMYAFLQDYDILTYYDGTRWTPASKTFVFANAAARDAYFASPFVGLSCYLTTEGYYTDYTGSGWVTRANGAVSNASTVANGIVQEGTDAQVAAQTTTGSTGGRLFINPGSTSLTAAANKIPVAGAGAVLDNTWAPAKPFFSGTAGESITAGMPVYIKASDLGIYKASNVSIEAASVVGFALNTVTVGQTVYVQTSGIVSGLSGLSSQEVFLDATAGTMTTTRPTTDSSTVIPVRLGFGLGTTALSISIQRLQRSKLFTQTIANTDASYTLSCGFIPGIVMANSQDFVYNSASWASIHGYANTAAGTYNCVTGNSSTTGAFLQYWGASNAGSNTTEFTCARSGTNVVLTRSINLITTAKASNIIVFEDL